METIELEVVVVVEVEEIIEVEVRTVSVVKKMGVEVEGVAALQGVSSCRLCLLTGARLLARSCNLASQSETDRPPSHPSLSLPPSLPPSLPLSFHPLSQS